MEDSVPDVTGKFYGLITIAYLLVYGTFTFVLLWNFNQGEDPIFQNIITKLISLLFLVIAEVGYLNITTYYVYPGWSNEHGPINWQQEHRDWSGWLLRLSGYFLLAVFFRGTWALLGTVAFFAIVGQCCAKSLNLILDPSLDNDQDEDSIHNEDAPLKNNKSTKPMKCTEV